MLASLEGPVMHAKRFESFEEFWPFYVKEHSKKTTRVLHFAGTSAAMLCVAGGLLTKRRWLLGLAPIVGYGSSWIGHFFVEKNKPATFTYPVWSLRADLLMWSKMVRGTMDAEVERVLGEERVPSAKNAEAADGGAVRVEAAETVN